MKEKNKINKLKTLKNSKINERKNNKTKFATVKNIKYT